MSESALELAALGRLLGAAVLLCAPGAALCYWLFPRRALDSLERIYLSVLGSLCLLTLIGVGLLEVEGRLDPRALAYWSAACTAACAVMRGGATIVARGQTRHRGTRSGQRPRRSAPTNRRTEPVSHLLVRGEVIRIPGTRQPIPARFPPRCYRVGRCSPKPVASKAVSRLGCQRRSLDPTSKNGTVPQPPKSSETTEVWRRRLRWALPRAALLGTVSLTLVAYRICAVYRGFEAQSDIPNGPIAAFSIPSDRLQEVQLALQGAPYTGGSTAIPFCIEQLGHGEGLYRVEAWVAERVGETPPLRVSAGIRYCGELDVPLTAGVAAPLDLYLYPAQAIVPLAHLRLWPEA